MKRIHRFIIEAVTLIVLSVVAIIVGVYLCGMKNSYTAEYYSDYVRSATVIGYILIALGGGGAVWSAVILIKDIIVQTIKNSKQAKEIVYINKSNEKAVKDLEMQIAEFNHWLINNDFHATKVYGDFMCDVEQMLWCKLFDKRIFNMYETVDARVCNKIVDGKIVYTVLVDTKDISAPIVTFDCEESPETAEAIRATIMIIVESSYMSLNAHI